MRYLFLLFIASYLFAQDSAISVNHNYIVFKTLERNGLSENTSVIVTNNGYFPGIAIGSVSITGGPHSKNFMISNDGCSNTTLEMNSSCTIQTKFTPNTKGIKSSVLEIPYGNSTQKLSVFLTNYESLKHKAKDHLPPVVSSLNIPEEMNAGTTYQLSFSATGYHSGYEIMAVMFDCTGMSEGTCGSSYNGSEKFYETGLLSPTSSTKGEWSSGGVNSTSFDYTFSFTTPVTRADGSAWSLSGTPVVIRFYNKSSEDIDRGSSSLSLVIPGGLSNNYYDTSGRKVQKLIYPPN